MVFYDPNRGISLIKRRVVVTGMGALTPVGLTVEESWRNILAGVSGVGRVEDFDTTDYATKIWAKVKPFDIERYMPLKDAKRMDLFTQYGMIAADVVFKPLRIIRISWLPVVHGEYLLSSFLPVSLTWLLVKFPLSIG